MEPALAGGLAVFLAVVKKERLLRLDAALLRYGVEDLRRRLVQMQAEREETLLKEITNLQPLVAEVNVLSQLPVDMVGVAQQEQAVA